MNSALSDKSVVYNLLRLVREQREAIHQLRLMVGAMAWFVAGSDEEKWREFNAMMWMIDQGKPADTRDQQWEAYLAGTQREVELGRPEIPS
jgi:hypothetical protein